MSDLKKVKAEDSEGFLVDYAIAVLREIPQELRCDVFAEFCKFCGSDDPSCQCWNDE